MSSPPSENISHRWIIDHLFLRFIAMKAIPPAAINAQAASITI